MCLSYEQGRRLPEKSGWWEVVGSDWMDLERGSFCRAGSVVSSPSWWLIGFSACDNCTFLFHGVYVCYFVTKKIFYVEV